MDRLRFVAAIGISLALAGAGGLRLFAQSGRHTRPSPGSRWPSLAEQTAEMGKTGDWPYYGGNKSFDRYSPLYQINAENVKDLEIAWTRPGVDESLMKEFPDLNPSHYYNATPVMVDGVLYAPDAIGLLEAIDPATGKTIWVQQPYAPTMREAAGRSVRGIDTWREGSDLRLILVRGNYLYEVNAQNGKLYPNFGANGRVDLQMKGPYSGRFHDSSGPIVVRNVIVVGGSSAANGAGDGGFIKEASPDDVRGYDVRTGKLLWTFHVIPLPRQFGHNTWGDHSADFSGNAGTWNPLSADEQLGFVYLPLKSATNPYYGGWRHGDNLFTNCVVAVDVESGKMRWYFQMIHHDLWDYESEGPPVLGDITVDGRRIKALMQANKNGFLYVLDRTNGKPVWPMVERPVPASTVPGERASPTQPFPTKPPALSLLQDLTENDLIDFTPELHKEALEATSRFTLAPMYTPPALRSDKPDGKNANLISPGDWGSPNWNTGAFDPETDIYYGVTMRQPEAFGVVPASQCNCAKATMAYNETEGSGANSYLNVQMTDDMPYVKPPYGHITAIQMDQGNVAWRAADGDGIRNAPQLQGLHLPMLGVQSRPAAVVTKTLLFLGEGSDAIIGTGRSPYEWGKKFIAYDKANGKVISEIELPSGTTGGPMTYLYQGKQYIAVAVGSRKEPPELVALTLR
jgi:quinoprotein glucose dehydrogenase